MAKKKKNNTPKQKTVSSLHKQLVSEEFSDIREHLKNVLKDRHSTINDFDLTEPWYSRRIQAVTNYIPVFIERYSEKYPDLDAALATAVNCSTPIKPYDLCDGNSHITLGAAIWMLDRIKEAGRMNDACVFLPSVDWDDVDMPELFDPCHALSIIRAMVYAIQTRHGFVEPKKGASRQERYNAFRTITDIPTATQEGLDCEEREDFHCILDLIPQADKDAAVAHFKAMVWEWTDLFHELSYDYTVKSAKISRRIANLKQELTELKKSASIPGLQKKPNVLMRSAAPVPAPTNGFALQNLSNPVNIMERKIDELRSLDEQSHTITSQQHRFRMWAQAAAVSSIDAVADDCGQEAAEKLCAFQVDDPYEICFALIYLLEQNDDLPWLYYFPSAVVAAAEARLPWGMAEYFEEDDYVWHPEAADYRPGRKAKVPEQGLDPDWYELRFRTDNPAEDVSRDSDRVNLVQLVYQMTGAIMPRNTRRYEVVKNRLKKGGLRTAEVGKLLGVMAVLGENQRQSRQWIDEHWDEDEMDEGNDEDIEALQAELQRLKKENDRLKAAVHEAGAEAKEQTDRLEKLKADAEKERQELADLRELVFNQQEGTYEREETETQIAFPCRTEHRIVVFGGHDSWAREIKPKLPDVRFIARDALPNADMIRKADVVWIQPNALCHAFFYKIIDEVRKHHIPLRYFTYASAIKCAEQLVMEDRK